MSVRNSFTAAGLELAKVKPGFYTYHEFSFGRRKVFGKARWSVIGGPIVLAVEFNSLAEAAAYIKPILAKQLAERTRQTQARDVAMKADKVLSAHGSKSGSHYAILRTGVSR